ncbi:unnamed protein product [Lampetra planeri]
MEKTPKPDKVKSVYHSPGDPLQSSPRGSKPHQKLSASLKERLKRSRRSFTSPFSVAKRLCVDEEEGRQVPAEPLETLNNPPLITQCVDVNRNEAGSGSQRFSGTNPGPIRNPSKDLAQREQLSREVKDKTEKLRRLKMVKMYRSKNDLRQLQTLIDKWRSCSQAALYELQSEVPIDGRKASMSELIDLFGLDEGILHFDRTEEDFTS